MSFFGPPIRNGVPIGLGSSIGFGSAPFTPAELFYAGEQGFWYDPTDIPLTWRRNLLTYTEQFDNAAWVKTNATVTPNATVAPDGTTTADKLVSAAATAHERVEQAVTITASTAYTLTAYAKADGANFLGFRVAQDAAPAVWFDLVNGIVGTVESGWSAATITAAGNGWYRCKATYTTVGTSYTFRLFLAESNNSTLFTGDGVKGLFIWGAQLELGSTASNYQQIVTPEISFLTYQSQPVLYQDSAGTTPVTAVEQAVGLMLDKSKGLVLGSELVTNGGLTVNTTGWTAANGPTLSNGPNGVSITNAGATNGLIYQAIPTVIGQWYRFSVSIVSGGTPARLEPSSSIPSTVGGGFINVTASGTYSFYYAATSTTTYVVAGNRNDSNATNTYGNITVKSLFGNHAFQTTSAKRPVLRARYNLLTYSENFSNAFWAKSNCAVTTTALPGPYGNNNGTLFTFTADGGNGLSCTTLAGLGSGTTCVWSLAAKYGTWRWFELTVVRSGVATRNWVDMLNGVAGTTNSAGFSITSGQNGWIIISLQTGSSGVDEIYFTPRPANGNAGAAVGNNGATFYVTSQDIRPTSQATGLIGPTYQRIAAATDYDVVGFLPYLQFDGFDDALTTNSIDFSATDKMTVFAGVRKLSDAAAGVFAELSADIASNNGSFLFQLPSSAAANNVRFTSKGTTAREAEIAGASVTSPVSLVLTGIGDISGDVSQLRVNASSVNTNTGDQGTGNFGNYPLFIGARNQTSLYLNGWLTQLIGRGASTTAGQTTATEQWVGQRTGVQI